MSYSLSIFAGAGWQFFDNNGVILSGGKLYVYSAGTTSLATTYTTNTGSTANTNPIILNSAGRLANEIWLTTGLNYKFILKTSADVLIGTWDNIPAGTTDVADLQAALASSTGAGMIGYTQGGTAVVTTVQAKLRTIFDIRDYGGNPDGTTDNTTAFNNLVTANGSYCTIKFPFVQGTSSNYYFNYAYVDFAHLTFDVDEGVTLSFVNDAYLYFNKYYKVVRPFLSYAAAIQSYAWIGNERNRPITNKYDYLNYSDIDASTLKSVQCNTSELQHVKVLWNTGDTFTTDTPTATSISGVQWANPSLYYIHSSLARVQPGDEISAYFDGVVNAQNLTCLVRGTGGYGGVYTTVTDTGAGTEQFQKDIGVAAVTGTVNYWGKGEHASYAGYRSVWTIRIISWTKYVVLYNGMQVSIGAINGAITDAGFGTILSTSDPATTCTISDWVIRRNNNVVGSSNGLIVATFGDSITAERYECWPNYMRENVEGGLGNRLVTLYNRAVSGDNAAGQWAIMNSQGIGGASIVVIQIGTNDIQVLTSKASYLANLENMRAYCVAHGATPIFGIPPMFYGRGQAGLSHGQATTNYELGAYIRSAVLRFCADKNLRCVDTNQYLGPILANYVNSGFTPYWGNDIMNDPMVTDNIHPSVVMEKLLGLAYARAVLGTSATAGYNIKPNSLYSTEVSLPATTPQNSWTFTTGTPTWLCDDDGNIEFIGVVNKSTGSLADGTIIMSLPRNMWPRVNKRMVCATSASTKPCLLDISTTGDVKIYGADATVTYVYLDGLTWSIKQG